MSRTPKICVCIPTYKRPRGLANLLCALGKQTIEEPFSIVVGNNDTTPVRNYTELSEPTIPVFTEIFALIRGVSFVRNALIAEALQKDFEWVAFIDDDQLPASDWLFELVSAGRRHRGDLVGGPVLQLPEVLTFWSSGATDTSYLPDDEGSVRLLNETGNLLLSTKFMKSFERAPFLLEFGHSGGEDYEFFLFARSLGARFVWAPKARVTEVVPRSRLTLRGLLWRQYSTSAYQAKADCNYAGAMPVIRGIVWNAISAPAIFLRAAVRVREFSLPTSLFLRRLAAVAGAIAGLIGVETFRYGRPES